MAETVKTQTMDRLQPWQALFGILTYVVGAFDLSQWQVLLLCGFLLMALAFVQRSTYRHKEAIKEVVAPWLVERLLCVLDEYLPAKEEGDESPTSDAELIEGAHTLKAEMDELKAMLVELEVSKDGTSNSDGSS